MGADRTARPETELPPAEEQLTPPDASTQFNRLLLPCAVVDAWGKPGSLERAQEQALLELRARVTPGTSDEEVRCWHVVVHQAAAAPRARWHFLYLRGDSLVLD